MTLLEDRPAAPPVVPSPAPAAVVPDESDAPAPAPAATTGAETLVRALLVVLVVMVAGTAVWKAFDQVVAPAWYRNRQRHLASDYTVQRHTLAPGQAAAVLQIPGIGADLMVVEGSDPNELRNGPGHRRGTPLPGDRGNSIVEGHDARWGAPFADLGKLVPRTRIDTVTRTGLPMEYRVTLVKVVKRADLARYLAPSRDFRITLITHHGGAFTDDRLVVQGVSGPVSRRPGRGPTPPLDPPAGSIGASVLLALLCAVGGGLAVWRLRRDHGRLSLGVVVVPLALGGLLALLLTVDSTLSALL